MSKKRKAEYKESFDVFRKYEPFFTGGRLQFTKDGQFLLSMCGEKIKVFNIQEGKTHHTIENVDEISTFLLAEDDETLIIAAKNGIMRHWHYLTNMIKKTWKSLHLYPVCCMTFDSTTTLLATGSSDSTVKVWDIVRKYHTHNLKGGKGVYSIIYFQKVASELCVFGAADDYLIHIWNLNTSQLIISLEGHYSTITNLIFSKNNMLSAGRDKVTLVWDIPSFKMIKTIPIYETVEVCILAPAGLTLADISLSEELVYFITAGDKGVLKVWDSFSSRCVYEQQDSPVSLPDECSYTGPLIIQGAYIPALEAIGIVTFEHNIILYSIKNFTLKKQFAGYVDDILSLKFVGPRENYLAVGTNSSQIKIFQFPNFSCQLLKGHLDTVLALDVFRKHKHILVSGSKDNSVKVWIINSELVSVNSMYTGYGHTDSVSAVACCKGKAQFFASGSEDMTLKLWNVPEKKPTFAVKLLLTSYCTVKAHDKHINSIDIAENDKLIASGSQDHTAKIWDTNDLSLVATLRGHRKGIWCVKFSPVDLAVATSSSDGTIRIWSLVDFACLKIFQGHEASVLQVQFLSRGMQLISSAADGNIKLWDIKNSVCIKTLEEHDTKVWTITVSADEEFVVSGGADSNIVVWQDTTKIQNEKNLEQAENFIMQEQKLVNLVHEENWSEALALAVLLEKPYLAYSIIEEILLKSGQAVFEKVFSSLRQEEKESLLKFAAEWITNSKTYYPSVIVINLFCQSYNFQDLLKIPSIPLYVRNLLPYLDRHFKRLNRRCQDMQILSFLCQQFKFSIKIPNIHINGDTRNSAFPLSDSSVAKKCEKRRTQKLLEDNLHKRAKI